ncbi:MAG: hypothetical protein IPN60_18405 [Saprospiraceae bacterium]|nr:hypothetical protein [Candidatus Opimibacter skivensis]
MATKIGDYWIAAGLVRRRERSRTVLTTSGDYDCRWLGVLTTSGDYDCRWPGVLTTSGDYDCRWLGVLTTSGDYGGCWWGHQQRLRQEGNATGHGGLTTSAWE